MNSVPTCEFMYQAARDGAATLFETQKHIVACAQCKATLEEFFESYQSGFRDAVGGGGPTFPPGIQNAGQFLERWFVLEAAMRDDTEFSLDQMNQALESQVVQDSLRRFAATQTSAIQQKLQSAPVVLLEMSCKNIENGYRRLYRLMGHRAFWSYFSRDIPQHGDDSDIEEIIAWWREALLGARE